MASVSVIIPNYNHARYLQQRIQSVLNQYYKDIELIILDDCSQDNSREIIEQFRDHPMVSHIVYNEVNSGSTFRQWEKGIGLARGEWIWIAESDDYSDEAFLQTVVDRAEKYKDVGISFCNSHWVDDQGKAGDNLSIYKESFFKAGPEEVMQLAIHCTIQNGSSCIVSRAYAERAIRGLGVYKACGDWIFYARILQQANIVYAAEKLNYFRWYHANVSSKAKDRLWITEGVDVLKNIDFSTVLFGRSEFWFVTRHWMKKANALNIADKLKVLRTVINTINRYYRKA